MRRSRRGGGSGLEFGSSGEDSFVAVVVTKLTGALLFILLLTMVIMALLPKAVDVGESERAHSSAANESQGPLRITTPGQLPEAIAGRAYTIALAATGGRGRLEWSSRSPLPDWLALDTATGQLSGTPSKPTDEPDKFEIQVSDGSDTLAQPLQLAVLPFQSASTPWWRPRVSRVDVGTWLEQGVGFLVLWLVHLLGMNLLTNFERNSFEHRDLESGDDEGDQLVKKRYALYRLLVRVATVSAMAGLAGWILLARAS
jgi:preprotein translocase subunit SecG